MRKYKVLNTKILQLDPKAETVLDLVEDVVLLPQQGKKIFLHWINKNGKLQATLTLTQPTQISGSVTVINGSDEPISLEVINL